MIAGVMNLRYLQAVAGGKGENLTCFAAWFGVHGDGTMEL